MPGFPESIRRLKIREQDPLKQGLKPKLAHSKPGAPQDSRARSTKTRIETFFGPGLYPKRRGIREQDPLKQGLKLVLHGIPATRIILFASKIH